MIALADAQALRDRVRRGAGAARRRPQRRRTPRGRAGAVRDDASAAALSGLFSFSLLFLAAISASLQKLDQFGLVDMGRLVHARARRGGRGLFRPARRPCCSSRSSCCSAWSSRRGAHGRARFRLPADPHAERGLRRRRGLFTLSEVVIPIRRTQVALIESGADRALARLVLALLPDARRRPKEGGVQVAAPFARMEEIVPILAEAGFPRRRRARASSTRRAGRSLRRAGPWLLVAAVAGGGRLLHRPLGRDRRGGDCSLLARRRPAALAQARPTRSTSAPCSSRAACSSAGSGSCPSSRPRRSASRAARSSAGCGSPACSSTPPAPR